MKKITFRSLLIMLKSNGLLTQEQLEDLIIIEEGREIITLTGVKNA